MSHHINETELVSRKVTKHKFRKSIIEDWDSCCYICGEKFANITLDHIVPKKSGGHTSRANLAPCCSGTIGLKVIKNCGAGGRSIKNGILREL